MKNKIRKNAKNSVIIYDSFGNPITISMKPCKYDDRPALVQTLGFVNYLSILACAAGEHYDSLGLSAMSHEAFEFRKQLHSVCDKAGVYDEFK